MLLQAGNWYCGDTAFLCSYICGLRYISIGQCCYRFCAKYSLCTKSGPLPVFINKVLLEPSHTHLLIYRLWLLWLQGQSWVVTTETVWPAKPEIFLLWPVTEKVCRSLIENIDPKDISRLQKYYWLSGKKKGLVIFGIYEKYIFNRCVCTSRVTGVYVCVFWGGKGKTEAMWKLMQTAMWTLQQNIEVPASKWWLTWRKFWLKWKAFLTHS